MTLTNHLLTGAALSKFLPLPLAIPAAFVSHFVLDALPHFGFPDIETRMHHLGLMRAVIAADFLLAVAASVWLMRAGHLEWFLVGLIAYSPDALWIYRFTVEEKFGTVHPTKGNRFIQFHRAIQKYERTWGVCVEIIYGLLMVAALR